MCNGPGFCFMLNTTFSFSIHPSGNIWVASTSSCLWIMLQECGYTDISEILHLILLCKYPKLEFLDLVIILFLIFWETAILFSIAAAPFDVPEDAQMFQCLHTLTNTFFLFILNIHPNRCEVVSHCGFDWHFSSDWWC